MRHLTSYWICRVNEDCPHSACGHPAPHSPGFVAYTDGCGTVTLHICAILHCSDARGNPDAKLIQMPDSHILFRVEESGIALLTVNRPEKLNALSGAVIGEMADAFGRVGSDAAIRALVLTGAGEKAFVAGG